MTRKSTPIRQTRAQKKDTKEYGSIIRYTSAIVLFACGVLFLLAIFGAAGPVGAGLFTASYAIVGIGAFVLPIALIAVGIYAGFGRSFIDPLTASGTFIITASVLAFAGLFPGAQFGGETGTWFGEMLSGFFGFWGAFVLLIASVTIGVAIVSDIETLAMLLGENVSSLWERIQERRAARRAERESEEMLESADFDDVVGVP